MTKWSPWTLYTFALGNGLDAVPLFTVHIQILHRTPLEISIKWLTVGLMLGM